jgi:DNA-binding NtrC family response regulator
MGACSLADSRGAAAIVGQSPATVRLRLDIGRVAPYSSNILITGPSGTGKELVARQVHALGPRARQPFVPVDCASMSGELMASQLFGHVPGAFTGANCSALGCVRAANRGTLFLDEIGELDYALQAKLLRVLQERVVTPVGSHQGERVDVQVVAATNRNLRDEVRAGRFREDLYYRLHVIHLQTTPLRERTEDISSLAATFLKQLEAEGLPCCTLSAGAERTLAAYAWPGNVRQLRNVLEQAVIEAGGLQLQAEQIAQLLEDDWRHEEYPEAAFASTFEASDIDASSTEYASNGSDSVVVEKPPSAAWTSLACLERDHLVRTLEHTFYNRAAAARLLGITRQSLLRKMERHAIRVPGELNR